MDRRRFVMRLIGPRLARRLIPRSLFGRSLLIIILPIALMQLAVVWAFFTAHQDTVTSRLSEGLAGEIAAIVELYSEEPGRLPQIAAMAGRHFRIEKSTGGDVARTSVERLEDGALVEELCRMLGADAGDAGARRHAKELLAA